MENVLPIIIAVFASSGFWAFATAVYTNMKKKDSAETRLLLGLAYKEISDRCNQYLDRGYITVDEYKDLNKYFYEPYRERGGNGTCEKLFNEVSRLPIVGG